MLGNNNPSSFVQNEFNAHDFGMHFDNSGSIPISFGEQLRKGNRWITPSNIYGAWLVADGNIGYNQFKMHSNTPTFNPFVSASNWFVFSTGVISPTCYKNSPSIVLNKKELDIISGVSGPILNQHQPWFESMNLLFRIHLLPEYRVSAAQNYATTMVGTSQNEFGLYMANFVRFLSPDQALSQKQLQSQVKMDEIQIQVDSLIGLLSPKGDLNQDALLFEKMRSLYADKDIEALKITDSQVAQIELHNSAVLMLQNLHNALPQNNLLEIVMKKILAVDLMREQGFSPYTELVQRELYGIATSDANTVGEAAHWAAQRLSGCFEEQYDAYFEALQNAAAQQQLKDVGEKTQPIWVYPNPTRDRFSCSTAESKIVKAQIYSPSGGVVDTQEFSTGVPVVEFETLQWPEALYRVVVTTEAGRIFSSNISVLR